MLTTDAGLVWAWPNAADDERVSVLAVAAPDAACEPVQCARELAATAFGLDSYYPRLRLLAWTDPEQPHPGAWTHLYAWEGGETPDTDTITGTGWWDDPAALLSRPASLTPETLATLRTAYGDGS